MTLEDIRAAFNDNPLGTLSLVHPRIADPDDRFSLWLKVPKQKKNPKGKLQLSQQTVWVVFERPSGERDDRFMNYDAPVNVAIGRNGKVLLIKTEYVYIAHDVQTTQVLNRYPVN